MEESVGHGVGGVIAEERVSYVDGLGVGEKSVCRVELKELGGLTFEEGITMEKKPLSARRIAAGKTLYVAGLILIWAGGPGGLLYEASRTDRDTLLFFGAAVALIFVGVGLWRKGFLALRKCAGSDADAVITTREKGRRGLCKSLGT